MRLKIRKSKLQSLLILISITLTVVLIVNSSLFDRRYIFEKGSIQIMKMDVRASLNSLFRLPEAAPPSHESWMAFDFDIERHVLVFVHVQKTGGSDFDRNIVKRLLISNHSEVLQFERACTVLPNVSVSSAPDSPAKTLDSLSDQYPDETYEKPAFLRKKKYKKFECNRARLRGGSASLPGRREPNWYFSRQTFGWVCGLHADYTELSKCVPKYYPEVDKRDIVFYTILRDPVKRYLSEWQHVYRGATWRPRQFRWIKNKCSNFERFQACFKGSSRWFNASLTDFMACQANLANNRQTRMLAHHDEAFQRKFCAGSRPPQPDDRLAYEQEILTRAKETLRGLVYFAINEHQQLSQALFEKTFSANGHNAFQFERAFSQSQSSVAERILAGNHSGVSGIENLAESLHRIRQLNRLDLELYSFALRLFAERLDYFKIKHDLNSLLGDGGGGV